jgi:peptidyl-prolyl cis-trans isomerase D
VIAYCTDIKEEGYASLEEVENDVRYAVLREKKAVKLISDMNESTQGMDNIDDISSALGLAVQEATNISFSSISLPSSGIEPAIIATASGAEEGFLSKPLKGNNGIFIISVNTVTPVEQAQDIELLKIMLSSNFEIRASFEAFEALKNEMIIVDKRYKFY